MHVQGYGSFQEVVVYWSSEMGDPIDWWVRAESEVAGDSHVLFVFSVVLSFVFRPQKTISLCYFVLRSLTSDIVFGSFSEVSSLVVSLSQGAESLQLISRWKYKGL